MLTLVGRARRRLFHNELFNQTAHAATAILLAFILLLLLGTQILDWRWIAGVSVVAAGTALYRARKRRPSLYSAAQVVDHRLALADTLSTAVFFQEGAPLQVSPEVREFQHDRAKALAESLDVRRAIPYAMPRAVYALVVVALVAGSLFALRYGILGRLDLQPPLAHMLQQQLLGNRPETAKNNARKPPQSPDPQDEALASMNDPDPQSMQPDNSVSDGNDAASDPSADKKDSSQSGDKQDGDRNGKASADDQEAKAESDPSQSGQNSNSEAGKQEQKQQSGKPDGNNSAENSSLLNKAKDMLQNMLSSLKPPQSNPGNQQQNGDPKNQQGKDQQKQQDKNGQKQNSSQKADESQGEQGEQSQDQQDQSQQANGKNDSKPMNKQPGSGAGNQDGDKRIKQAEDLAAMGKITEIIGKRSATVTGEATVEVQSTSQQLKTAYAAGTAQHGQSGGEIDRDEIPVAMQPFVQEYFKQARKPAPPSQAPATKKQ